MHSCPTALHVRRVWNHPGQQGRSSDVYMCEWEGQVWRQDAMAEEGHSRCQSPCPAWANPYPLLGRFPGPGHAPCHLLGKLSMLSYSRRRLCRRMQVQPSIVLLGDRPLCRAERSAWSKCFVTAFVAAFQQSPHAPRFPVDAAHGSRVSVNRNAFHLQQSREESSSSRQFASIPVLLLAIVCVRNPACDSYAPRAA
ncbi:hypothetical protein EJ04DRAFT_600746 [Polyplosphaeria fusca]|uniref:Uncharacterized protein n=1 Tax=Polyplosphaeria fusca TaxID=682080 RepID=A0A9P4V8C8_9PLEO|nr:hypothetical protein EJ04DRAFT_600746 [Polyplosphaeria fusca]